MMEKELADTEARQEKVDHKLKERIGNKQENIPPNFCSRVFAERNTKVCKSFKISRYWFFRGDCILDRRSGK